MSIFRTYNKHPKKEKKKKKRKYKPRKGSDWTKNAQSRKEWLKEQGFDDIDDYIDKILEDLEE